MPPEANKIIRQLLFTTEILKPLIAHCNKGFQKFTVQMGKVSKTMSHDTAKALDSLDKLKSQDNAALKQISSNIDKVAHQVDSIFYNVQNSNNEEFAFKDAIHPIITWCESIKKTALDKQFLSLIDNNYHTDHDIHNICAVVDNLNMHISLLSSETINSLNESEKIFPILQNRLAKDLSGSINSLKHTHDEVTEKYIKINRQIFEMQPTCDQLQHHTNSSDQIFSHLVQTMQLDDMITQRLDHNIKTLMLIADQIDQKQTEDWQKWAAIALKITMDQIEETLNELIKAITLLYVQIPQFIELTGKQIEYIETLRTLGIKNRHWFDDAMYTFNNLLRLFNYSSLLISSTKRSYDNVHDAVRQANQAMTNTEKLIVGKLEKLVQHLFKSTKSEITEHAKTIQELALKIQNENPSHSENLEKFIQQIQTDQHSFVKTNQQHHLEIKDYFQQITHQRKLIDHHLSDLINNMNNILSNSQAPAIQLILLISRITFHVKIKKESIKAISIIQQSMVEICDDVKNTITAYPDKETAFQSIHKLYTMSSERICFNKTLGLENDEKISTDEDNIELF